MFFEVTRILPASETTCTLNSEQIVWAQPFVTGDITEIFMVAGEPLKVRHTYAEIRTKILEDK